MSDLKELETRIEKLERWAELASKLYFKVAKVDDDRDWIGDFIKFKTGQK